MNMKIWKLFVPAFLALVVLSGQSLSAADWKPADGILLSKFADSVNPAAPHPEYPRPQMTRETWKNLNGLWDYAILPVGKDLKETQGKILVPFAVESALSGVAKTVGKENNLWYKKSFSVPKDWNGKRIILHFGAVDWRTEVFVNDKKVGAHEGGYSPFCFDITDALTAKSEQKLVLKVWDPTTEGPQPIGKQHKKPHGIWYTPVTGIWQTVWLEPVANAHIVKIKPVSDIDRQTVTFNVFAKNAEGATITICGAKAVIKEGQATLTIPVKNKKLWTPDSPNLYDFTAELSVNGKKVDSVGSYYAMRKISLGKTADGITRLMLNNEFLFQHGPLDQGWWPDGLYTAPTVKALVSDVIFLKAAGFNMLRKHVKVEPAIFYYHCDKLGMLVWQDMPSGDTEHYISPKDPDAKRSPESAAIFEAELKEMILSFDFFPSIIMWVPFNEGWGQYDTPRIVEMVRKLDNTRLVNNTSGWSDRNCGDVYDKHQYPGPGMFPPEEKRATVLGEYGGLGLPVKGHSWKDNGNWGYVKFDDKEALFRRYRQLNRHLRPLILKGLSAAVYTQTTDVEIEVNGLMSYDRKVVKMPVEKLFETNTQLRVPLSEKGPEIREIAPNALSEKQQIWKYTFDKPADNWTKCDFNDSAWKSGPAGFGTKVTPNTTVRTVWNTKEIWLRRTVELDEFAVKNPEKIFLMVFHDEDAEVMLNGIKIASFQKFVGEYQTVEPDFNALKKAVKKGKNTLSVHCKQTVGGQYIDVGIIVEFP